MNTQIKMRPVNSDIAFDDKKFVFNVRNNDLSIKNSLNNNPISWEQHCLWYEKTITNVNNLFYIFSLDADLIGYFRADESNKVSVALDKKYVGKGLSTEVIRLGTIEVVNTRKSVLVAEIKKTNVPSIKSFTKAGYEYHSNYSKDGETIDVYRFSI